MTVSEDRVMEALRRVLFPGFSRDIVSLGIVRKARLAGDRVRVELELTGPASAVRQQVGEQIRSALVGLEGVREIEIVDPSSAGSPSLRVIEPSPRPSVASGGALDPGLIPEVRHTVAVASGKGGVGKSTVAVNLAAGLAALGGRVGLLDADIYGPSIPLMTGLATARPVLDPSTQRLVPFERFGVRWMSLGFLMDPDQAVIWRGPMVMKAIEQLLRDVAWGKLDVLVVDMPPGTGDAQLTMSQRVRLSGAVIVTTPQDVALADAIKGVAMFRKVGVPVLGIVENMSYFSCPHCHQRSEIFGHGGGREQAERLGVPFLGEVPLDTAIRASGDAGAPIVATEPGSELATAFTRIASRVLDAVDSAGDRGPRPEPPGGR